MSSDIAKKNCDYDVCRDCKLGCCQDARPPLTKERICAIEEYLRSAGKVVNRFFIYSDYSFPSIDTDNFCIFYNKITKLCQIHVVKPETCRAGPVTFDINRNTRKVEWFLKTREVCLFAGKLFDTPKKFNEHFEIAKKELMRLICDLDSESLRAILTRDEPHTFKIGEDPLPKEVLVKLGLE